MKNNLKSASHSIKISDSCPFPNDCAISPASLFILDFSSMSSLVSQVRSVSRNLLTVEIFPKLYTAAANLYYCQPILGKSSVDFVQVMFLVIWLSVELAKSFGITYNEVSRYVCLRDCNVPFSSFDRIPTLVQAGLAFYYTSIINIAHDAL